jgi:tRNA(fMet)-specific endonuclease VapC
VVKLRYLLDSNICIYLMRHPPLPRLVERVCACKVGEIGISTITWAEVMCGLHSKNTQPQVSALREVLDVLPFDESAASIYGALSRAFPERRGSIDRMIAAHAIALDVPLITNNERDFSSYAKEGLTVENWS